METSPIFRTIYGEEIYSVAAPVTVILNVSWQDLNDDERLLLSKILQAVRQSLESVRIIHQPVFDLSSWTEKPAKILAFVEPPKGVSVYEIIPTGDTAVVFSDPLKTLQADDVAKRKLWTTLKTLFS